MFIVVFSTFFVSQISPLHNQVKSWYSINIARDFHRALLWLKEDSTENDVVLTNWGYGAQVAAHAQRPTVATCKVYPSEVKETAQRYKDIRRFFRARGEKTAMEVVKKYRVKYILLRGKKTKGSRLLDRMCGRERLKNFQLVYNSGRYIIYKVGEKQVPPEEIVRENFNSLLRPEKGLRQALEILKKEVPPDKAILTSLPYGEEICRRLNRCIIAPEGQIIEERQIYTNRKGEVVLNDGNIIDFFFARTEDGAVKIARKYNVHFILMSRALPSWVHPYIQGQGYLFRNKYRLSVKGNLTTIFGRMRFKMKFNNFELIYSSKEYLIYRIKTCQTARHFTRDFEKQENLKAFFKKEKAGAYPRIYGGIIPHSLESRPLSAQLLERLAKNQQVQRLILLGPNHFNLGKEKIACSLYDWETPFGIIEVDKKIAGSLLDKGLVKVDENVHEGEHSIRALLPFVKYKFPEARILPIVLKQVVTPEQARLLGEQIAQFVDVGTVIIASVDFSHYFPQEQALRHDNESVSAIRSFEKKKIYSLQLDSRPAILTLLECMERVGAKKTELLQISNSGFLRGNKNKSVGYVTIFFTR